MFKRKRFRRHLTPRRALVFSPSSEARLHPWPTSRFPRSRDSSPRNHCPPRVPLSRPRPQRGRRFLLRERLLSLAPSPPHLPPSARPAEPHTACFARSSQTGCQTRRARTARVRAPDSGSFHFLSGLSSGSPRLVRPSFVKVSWHLWLRLAGSWLKGSAR